MVRRWHGSAFRGDLRGIVQLLAQCRPTSVGGAMAGTLGQLWGLIDFAHSITRCGCPGARLASSACGGSFES